MQSELWADPAHPSMAIEKIAVTVERRSPSVLYFRYVTVGKVEELILPAPVRPSRADNLWRETCFEAFLRPMHGTAYMEFNFSPSGRWAAYDFCAYRAGMVQLALPAPPDIVITQSTRRLELEVTLSIDLAEEAYALSLAAVLEEQRVGKSYWAAVHPGDGAPDFHHPACFVDQLPPAA